MPSRAVDVAWHEFILLTRDYHAFCDEAFGHYLHHSPAVAMDEPVDATLARTVSVLDRHPAASPIGLAVGLPFLFALDAQLGIEDGNRWTEGEIDALRQTGDAADAGSVAGCRAGPTAPAADAGGVSSSAAPAAEAGAEEPGRGPGPTRREVILPSQRSSTRSLGTNLGRMFTGIVRELGIVEAADGGPDGIRLRVRAPQAAAQAGVGDSVSLNGVCLTVDRGRRGRALVRRSSRDARPTTLGRLRPGDGAECRARAACRASRSAATSCRAMSTGWGGCWPCLARGTAPAWRSRRLPELLRYCVEKGSICVEGVSLTVAALAPTELHRGAHPAHARGHDPRGAGSGRRGEPRGRRAREVRRAPAGVARVA